MTQVTIYITHPSHGELHHAGVKIVHDLEISDDEQDPDDLDDEQRTITSEEDCHDAVLDAPHGTYNELARRMAQVILNTKHQGMNG